MLLELRVWRDPLRGLLHDIFRYDARVQYQSMAHYHTACGMQLSVDDVNKLTLVVGEPTCLGCLIAEQPPHVIDREE